MVKTYTVQLKSGTQVKLMGTSQTTVFLTILELHPEDPPVRVFMDGEW